MPLSPLDSAWLAKLEALRLSVRWVRWGSRMGGRFAINRRGSSVEFADYAAYTPGDDIRSIDWNLYARSDRLFVKTYKEEIELAVEVFLDATASMGLPTPRKFERACQLAQALAYIGLAGRHHVRFSVIQPGRMLASAWGVHRAAITRLSDWLGPLKPGGQITLSDWTRQALTALRIRGGQAILLTDGMAHPADFFRAMHLLRMRHAEAKVIQVLSPQEFHPAELMRSGLLVDSETGLTHELGYSAAELERAVHDHNEQLAWFCKRNGIPFAQHRLDEPLEAFVMKTLPTRGFLE